MRFKNIREQEIRIKFTKFTQIANVTPYLGNDIYNYIINFFGNSKYTEDDLSLYNDQLPSINLNDLELSKNSYICIGINNNNDIDKVLEHKRDSLLMLYNKSLLETIEIQNEIDKLELIYNKIVQLSQDLYPKNSIIKIDEINVNLDNILNKMVLPYISKSNTNIEKFKQLIAIIKTMEYSGNKFILYLHNIETYLQKEELKIIQWLTNDISCLNVIISSSNSEYFDYTMVEDINFLYKDKVYDLPNITTLENKINMNIEKFITLKEYQIIDFLQKHSFKIITNDINYNDNYELMHKALLTHNSTKDFQKFDVDFCTII